MCLSNPPTQRVVIGVIKNDKGIDSKGTQSLLHSSIKRTGLR